MSAISLATLLSTALAQTAPEVPRPSPSATVKQIVGLTDFTVEYSSPGVKGRPIWGALVPYDQVWRTGANAVTKLTASREFAFGGKKVPAGTYALFTVPGKKSWKVILSSNTGAWGTVNYDKKAEVADLTVTPEAAPHRERLTFIFSNTTDDETRLDLEWEKLRIPVPLKVETRAHTMAGIDAALGEAWRPHFASARWLLQNDGDLDRALSYAETSIGIKQTWWNHWVKAEILGKKGRAKEAIEAAERATSLGKGDRVYEDFFKVQVTGAIAAWKQKS